MSEYYLATALLMYFFALYCLITKRNLLKLLIAVELAINAANLNFIALSAPRAVDPVAQSFVIMSIVIAACVTTIGVALIVYIYRRYRTLDVSKLRRLRW